MDVSPLPDVNGHLVTADHPPRRAPARLHGANNIFFEAHPTLWHPLEVVLSNWVDLVRLGKIAAGPPPETPRRCSGARRSARGSDGRTASPRSLLASPHGSGYAPPSKRSLLLPAALDAAAVPEGCFARAFLTRAPGLLVPAADAREFAAAQAFTRLPRAAHAIAPICLFAAAGGEGEGGVDLPGSSSPFCSGFCARSGDSPVPCRVRAGVYGESVDRAAFDNAEEGFRLLLPYGVQGDADDAGAGARKSDGSFVRGGGAVAELFQHGYKPFGGDYYRPQRLERLLDHWRRLVTDGVWAVGPQGVEGNLDTFREADSVRWRDYLIPPTW
ncbi:hypothetical protein F4823DRAFT_564850 [Ustulina deusta]|nr:hypothetical protein F4823DRAFT_564850 [Ustulina deusta]